MDSDSSSGSDSLRANWRPSQDHFFIDLLQDQAHRGNKTGHAFSKRAWAEMIVQFNTKFGFKYDLEVLKNRYKRMRKEYNEMTILVNQSEFKWDETQQMVIADNNAWNEYLKAHPDMQPYRTKAVPYYNELCIICGHTVADGRYSLSCFDVDFENEAKITDNQTPTNADRSKIDWSWTMDQYFLELMLDQVHKGNKIDRTFKKKAWMHMITSFNAKFGFQHSKVVLKNRYNVLRRQFTSIKILLAEKGFCWDEKQNMVIADDHVWNKYIQAHPSFRMYRSKSMPCYSDMCTICCNETASLKNNNSPSCIVSPENGNPERNNSREAMPIVNTDVSDDAQQKALKSGHDKSLFDQQKRRQPAMPRTKQQSKRAQRKDEGTADALQQMTVAVTSLTKKKENDDFVSTKDVIDALQAVPGIDDDLLLDACDFLEDDRRARMFLALNATLRMKWLMRKLRPQ